MMNELHFSLLYTYRFYYAGPQNNSFGKKNLSLLNIFHNVVPKSTPPLSWEAGNIATRILWINENLWFTLKIARGIYKWISRDIRIGTSGVWNKISIFIVTLLRYLYYYLSLVHRYIYFLTTMILINENTWR